MNIQYRFVRALSDKELIKKLLALDLTATTAKMLEVCHTHLCHLRQPQGHGIEGTEDSQCHTEANQAMPRGRNLQQTVCTHVDAAQSLTHLEDPHAQQGMTTAKDVENYDIGSPSAEVDKKDPRTRDPNTTTEEENRGRSLKLELMKTPIVMKLVLSQLFCRQHLTEND